MSGEHCARCGSSIDLEDCWACGGDGRACGSSRWRYGWPVYTRARARPAETELHPGLASRTHDPDRAATRRRKHRDHQAKDRR